MACWSSTEKVFGRKARMMKSPYVYSFGTLDFLEDTTLVCWGERGSGPVGLPRTSLGSETPEPHDVHQPSPKASPIDTHLNKTWNLSSSAAPPTFNDMLFVETAPATAGGCPMYHLPFTPELGQFSIVYRQQPRKK